MSGLLSRHSFANQKSGSPNPSSFRVLLPVAFLSLLMMILCVFKEISAVIHFVVHLGNIARDPNYICGDAEEIGVLSESCMCRPCSS